MVKRYRLDEVAKIEEGKIVPKKKYFTNVGVPLITAENLKKLMLNGDMNNYQKLILHLKNILSVHQYRLKPSFLRKLI